MVNIKLMMDSNIVVDCACVIHGNAYEWKYVENLYSMLTRNFSWPIRLHVYTESHRPVPEHMIKHVLEEWPGIAGPKKAWWYKMQLFNPKQFSGQLLYFDLDVVITGSLDWIISLDQKYFWCINDFRHIWRKDDVGINSSVMYWNTKRFQEIWRKFSHVDIEQHVLKFKGDQDYVSEAVDHRDRRYFDHDRIQSWRWQVLDGGLDPTTQRSRCPGQGPVLTPQTRIVVFHGKPKPHEITDICITQHWR